jgi:hypothetical protein
MNMRQLLLGSLLGTLTLTASAAPQYHPWLADSTMPQFHQGPWQQDSTRNPGPTSDSQLGNAQFAATGLVNVGLLESPAYADGKRVFWGGNVDQIYKLEIANGKPRVISKVSRYGGTLENLMAPFAGAYTAVRYDNTYLTGAKRSVLAYRDAVAGDRNSSIALYKRYEIPQSVAPDQGLGKPEQITGMGVLWDGKIAVVTRFGTVGVVDIENNRAKFSRVGSGESISNSIAVASDGGIYVVSDKAMYRFQWNTSNEWNAATLKSPLTDAASCSQCWRETYETFVGDGITFSSGSGSTPSLMGPNGEYVVITDGAKVANLSVYRTGTLQSGQTRLAARKPVNFGDANRERTSSEQSVVVSGYGMAVVSNDYKDVGSLGSNLPLWFRLTIQPVIDVLLTLPAGKNIDNARVTLLGYTPKHQPWGVQKFTFNPANATLSSSWVRNDVSCPNAVPLMSETSNRFYCVGARNYQWTIESLDWTSGGNHFSKDLGLLPRFNSFYALTQLTSDGSILYGSVDGVVYVPKQ